MKRIKVLRISVHCSFSSMFEALLRKNDNVLIFQSLRIPRRFNGSSFECNSCIDKWLSEDKMYSEYGEWGGTSHFSVSKDVFTSLATCD